MKGKILLFLLTSDLYLKTWSVSSYSFLFCPNLFPQCDCCGAAPDLHLAGKGGGLVSDFGRKCLVSVIIKLLFQLIKFRCWDSYIFRVLGSYWGVPFILEKLQKLWGLRSHGLTSVTIYFATEGCKQFYGYWKWNRKG